MKVHPFVPRKARPLVLSAAHLGVTIVCGLVVAAGIVGVIIPGIPGLLLSWIGVLLWTLIGDGGPLKWLFLAIATVIALVGGAIKYALPGRNMRASGVPRLSILAGAVLGIIGFFLIPVVGLPIGFVVGVLLVELARNRNGATAWQSTSAALKAVGLAVMLEVATAFAVAVVWVLAVFLAT
jgi:uncharacterized protein YqgC (DUF456 family)